MSTASFDVAIVGAGVLGTFHAYHAACLNKKVLLLEKDAYPTQATVRNFGQIVPSGMSQDWFEYATRSLEIYQSIQSEFDISIRNNGSVYVASDAEEQQLLHELDEMMRKRDYETQLLSRNDCVEKWPSLKKEYCQEALFFPRELSAEPDQMIHLLIKYLATKFPNLEYKHSSAVIECDYSGQNVLLVTSKEEKYTAEKVIICNGGEFKLLFPALFAQSGIVVSKLQMLRTVPLKDISLSGNILTGLTIRRYESFTECPSFSKLNTPHHLFELKKWGIHILFKQAIDGSIIIGDSHEYATVNQVEELNYEIKDHINRLILDEAERIVSFDVRKIASTWAGFYPQHPEKDIVEIDLDDKVHIRTAIGGKGMTSSAGYAEKSIRKIFQL